MDLYSTECIPKKVLDALVSFIVKFKELYGDVEVYLFGSYAKCSWVEDSDVDVIVVSNAFMGMDIGRRYVLVRKLLPSNMGFEILTYTRDEFEIARRKSIVILDAAEYWVKLSQVVGEGGGIR